MSKSNNDGNHQRAKKIARAVLAITLLASLSAWWFYFRQPSTPNEIIEVSGRIEGDDASVAAKLSGRIREISVREGDHVKAGQVIAVLDDDQVNARVTQARSNVEQAEAKLQAARQ